MPHEARIVSAHRTPERLYDYASAARGRGLQVIIAGAGGAAIAGHGGGHDDAAGAGRADRKPGAERLD